MEVEKTILEAEKTLLETNVIQKEEHIGLSSFKNYKVKKELPAKGSEADIFLVEKDNKTYILKLYRKGIFINQEVEEKIKNISQTNPHIIKVIEFGTDYQTNKHYEILEYAPYGSLDKFFLEKPADKKQIRVLVKQINKALKDIHDRGIIHRDLKPSNIMVKNINPLVFAISDFGISSNINNQMSKKITQVKGTPMYYAPESFSGIIGKEVDYWSLGMIILEILHKNPLKNLNTNTIMFKITSESIEVSDDIDDEIKVLLKGLLTQNRKYRWGYKELEDWLDGKINKVYYSYKEILNNKEKYTFLDKSFNSLENLIKFATKYKQKYLLFIKFVRKGYLSKQLSENNRMKEELLIDKIIEEENKGHIFIGLRVIKTLTPSLTPRILGITIDKQNILKFLLNYAKQNIKDKYKKEFINILLHHTEKFIKLIKNKEIKEIIDVYKYIETKTKNSSKAIYYTAKLFSKEYITPGNIQHLIEKETLKTIIDNLIENEKLEELNNLLEILIKKKVSEKSIRNLNEKNYIKVKNLIDEILTQNIPEKKLVEERLSMLNNLELSTETHIYPREIYEIINIHKETKITRLLEKCLALINILKNMDYIKPIEKAEFKEVENFYKLMQKKDFLIPFELQYIMEEPITVNNWDIFYKNFKLSKQFYIENKKEIVEV